MPYQINKAHYASRFKWYDYTTCKDFSIVIVIFEPETRCTPERPCGT